MCDNNSSKHLEPCTTGAVRATSVATSETRDVQRLCWRESDTLPLPVQPFDRLTSQDKIKNHEWPALEKKLYCQVRMCVQVRMCGGCFSLTSLQYTTLAPYNLQSPNVQM